MSSAQPHGSGAFSFPTQQANNPEGTGPMSDSKQVAASGKRKPPAAGKGRPKGSVNKTTALLKDAILQAAQQAGGEGGLVGYLELQAIENPGPFMSLLGKVLPTQHANADGGKIDFPSQIILTAATRDEK